jgi:hypothetical protein
MTVQLIGMPSTNAARQLWLIVPGGTPTTVQIPIVKFDEKPKQTRRSWKRTQSNGVVASEGLITAYERSHEVETRAFQTTDATPQLLSALTYLQSMKGKTGTAANANFVIVDPADGSKQQVNCDVMQIITLAGEEDNETIFKFTLFENGMPSAYTGTLTQG